MTSQIDARKRIGEWLPPDVLIASMHTWMSCHGIEYDWLERLRIGAASVTFSRNIYDMATERTDLALERASCATRPGNAAC